MNFIVKISSKCEQGGRGQKSESFVDIINGCPKSGARPITSQINGKLPLASSKANDGEVALTTRTRANGTKKLKYSNCYCFTNHYFIYVDSTLLIICSKNSSR